VLEVSADGRRHSQETVCELQIRRGFFRADRQEQAREGAAAAAAIADPQFGRWRHGWGVGLAQGTAWRVMCLRNADHLCPRIEGADINF
jgi:hypothetical protein